MITELEGREIAKKFLAAMRGRDEELMRSILADEVVWSFPGTSIVSGEAKGPEAVVQRARTIGEYGMQFELKNLLVGRDGAAVSLHNTARQGEAVFDMDVVTVLSIREGRVWAMDTYFSNVDMLNSYFVKRST